MDRRRVAELFEQALDLPAPQREDWLADACAGDEALHAELERLLRADAQAAAFMEQPPGMIRSAAAQAAEPAAAPERFGAWRVVRTLGTGGMGEVWLAERSDGEFEQRVAIKQLAWPTPGLMWRFRRERQILAQLEHPNIARLIDGGVDDAGAPYLVMEYVDGEPITDFARHNALDLPARLRLFLRVCDGVQYAHQALVVHRDLKPTNIFVTADGTPKLLDFGIAKVLTTTDGVAATRTVASMMTPDYAAPEQFSGGPVTTATDVYALGIILHELLIGSRPRRMPTGAGGTTDATERLPAPSSTLARGSAATATLRRTLRGDLDRIILTALEDQPLRRYHSAEAFAGDIRNYLDGRPISARRDSAWYRARKFARRNRVLLGAAAVAFAACIAATFVSLQQAMRAREQAALAQQEAMRANEVRRFLVGVFEQAAPDRNRNQPISAQQLVGIGARQLAENPHGDPSIHAELTGLIGDLYWDIGDYGSAEPMLQRAIAMGPEAGVPGVVMASNLQRLARTEQERQAFKEAIGHAGRALELARAAGPEGADVASAARRVIAAARNGMGDAAAAEALLREALADDRTRYGETSEAVAEDLYLLGLALKELSRYGEAIEVSRRAIEVATALHGRLHSSVVNGLESLASAQGHSGHFADAERNLREAAAIAESIFGATHRETIVARSNLLWTLEMQGHYAEALEGRLQLREAARALNQTRPDQLAVAWNFLSSDYTGLGRFVEAEHASRESLAIWRTIHGAKITWDGSDALKTLGTALFYQGRLAAAEAAFRELIAIQRAHEPPDSQWLNRSRGQLADTLRLAHRHDEALAEIRAAVAALPESADAASPIRIYLQSVQSAVELDAGDLSAAETAATSALAAARQAYPQGSFRLGDPLYAYARTRLARGHADEAEALLRQALEVRRPPYPDDDPRVLEVEVALVDALAAQRKTAEARHLRASLEPRLARSASNYAADLRAHLDAY
jgi:serine/threonine-protein kinase